MSRSRGSLETFFGTSRLSLEGWTSRSRLGLQGSTSWSHLGLEDITSRSRDFSLVNIHAMHQACGSITKKIMDLTHKKQVVKWQTSPVGVFKLRHCGLDTFFGTSWSRLGLEGWMSCLVSVLRVSENGTSRSRLGLEGSTSRSRLGLVT